MAREHMISIRFTEQEAARLRGIAEADGITVSEVLRRFIRERFAEPLPEGKTWSSSPVRFVQTPEGQLVQTGWMALSTGEITLLTGPTAAGSWGRG